MSSISILRNPHKWCHASAASAIIFCITIPALITADAQKYGYVQANCPTIVQKALDTVSAQCGKTTRGKLCYGNSNITAQFQPGVNTNTVKFQAPGDTVDVNAIKQFTLSGMSTTDNSWGVAEMKIKADLPDADPSQAVTMILFGDVQVTDASADAQNLVASLTPTPLVSLLDEPTATPAGPKKAVTPTTSTGGKYGGLQAFYFQSSDTAPCDQAPHDGILLQSPQGNKQRVTLIIDGAMISLGSTVYVTAQPGKFLTISTLEGSAQVTANGQTAFADPGSSVRVPIDAALHVSGAPFFAGFYSTDNVRALPIRNLPTVVAPVPGLPKDVVATSWQMTWPQTVSSNCGTHSIYDAGTAGVSMQSNIDNGYIWFDNIVMGRNGDGSYHGTYRTALYDKGTTVIGTHTDNYTFRFIDPDHISGTDQTTNYPFTGESCSFTLNLTIVKVTTGPGTPSPALTVAATTPP